MYTFTNLNIVCIKLLTCWILYRQIACVCVTVPKGGEVVVDSTAPISQVKTKEEESILLKTVHKLEEVGEKLGM